MKNKSSGLKIKMWLKSKKVVEKFYFWIFFYFWVSSNFIFGFLSFFWEFIPSQTQIKLKNREKIFLNYFLKEIFSLKSRIVSFIDKFMPFNLKKERLDLMNL